MFKLDKSRLRNLLKLCWYLGFVFVVVKRHVVVFTKKEVRQKCFSMKLMRNEGKCSIELKLKLKINLQFVLQVNKIVQGCCTFSTLKKESKTVTTRTLQNSVPLLQESSFAINTGSQFS